MPQPRQTTAVARVVQTDYVAAPDVAEVHSESGQATPEEEPGVPDHSDPGHPNPEGGLEFEQELAPALPAPVDGLAGEEER